MAKAWMRQLQVILTSNALRKRMIFGTNDNRGKDDLSISITGTKYMSSLKDAFTIKLVNLSYFEICELINGQYYDVEIKAGYKSAGLHTIFKGGVLYISNVFGDRKSSECMIFCASNLIAKYGQSRMNLGLNSGINMYAGIKFIANAAGIENSNVDESFKLKIFRSCEEATGTLANWLDIFCNSNNVCINTDASYSTDFTIFNPLRKDARIIKLTSNTIILTSGYPTLTNEGLNICLMPTFNFMCGDTIVLDNSIIDIGITNASDYSKNYGYYMDKEGKYLIYRIDYALENRSGDFSIKMLCKSKSLVTSTLGGLGYAK